MNTNFLRINRPQPYLPVGVLKEVGVVGIKDAKDCLFPMGIWKDHRKVPIRRLQRDSEFPFGAFLLSANEIFLKLTIFISIPYKSNLKRRK